ncbi:MAG: class I SAM-dependent methyltransferase [Beijerinckiaceae bacterium]
MMWSVESRGRAINAFQRDEIIGLAKADANAAAIASLRPHYTGIGEWLPSGMGGRVLELGCGPGRYAALLSAMGYDVVGVDPFSFPLWDEIKKHQKVELIEGIKAEALPFADDSFDHVACISALLYFDHAEKALSEMKRVLKPGGRLYVRTVNSRNLARRFTKSNIDPAAHNYYDESELANYLTKGGFTVKKTFTYGFFPPVMTAFWWYLCNGPIPLKVQEWLSSVTPADMRVTVMAFAQLPENV